MQSARFEISPCLEADVQRLQRELRVSGPLAQILVRRGHGDPQAARAFLEAGEEHSPHAFAGISGAVGLILEHSRRGARITVHGDYDVDGICSTAVLVRTLRDLGANVDSYLPDRARGLRSEHRHGRTAGRAGHRAAADGRLRHHGGGGGPSGNRDRSRRRGHRPSCATCGWGVAAGTDCAPGHLRLSVSGAVRHSRGLQAGAGARGGERGRREPAEAGSRPRRAGYGRRCRAADRGEPGAAQTRAACARQHRQARPARADGGREESTPAKSRRAGDRIRAWHHV